jgi:hypothetical protein
MTEYTCRKCGQPKTREEMHAAPSSPSVISKTCKSCKADAAGPAPTRRKSTRKKSAKREAPAPKPNGRLSIPAGYGVECYQEDGDLMIEQPNADGSTSVVRLTLAEARRVLDWISTHAEAA